MANKKFSDVELISALNIAEGNATHAAQELGVTRSAVVKRRDMLPTGALIRDVADFRIKRADVFADLQLKVLANITPDKLAKCSAQQLATIAAILYDKERLEAGKSTENVAHQMSENLSDEDRQFFTDLQQKRTESLRSAITYDDDE